MDQAPLDANVDIARFLRRLQWGLVARPAPVPVALLGPILSPFVFAAPRGWLRASRCHRPDRAGR